MPRVRLVLSGLLGFGLLATLSLLAPAVVFAASDCESVAGNLVGDCGFEVPVAGDGNFVYVAAGDTALQPWHVTDNGVDVVDNDLLTMYPVHSGEQSADLNHDSAGG